jgi:hypothetical protein
VKAYLLGQLFPKILKFKGPDRNEMTDWLLRNDFTLEKVTGVVAPRTYGVTVPPPLSRYYAIRDGERRLRLDVNSPLYDCPFSVKVYTNRYSHTLDRLNDVSSLQRFRDRFPAFVQRWEKSRIQSADVMSQQFHQRVQMLHARLVLLEKHPPV